MKLKPKDILDYLGFNIPEEGIEINPNDAYLYTHLLFLLGKTIDPIRIPSAELEVFAQTILAMEHKKVVNELDLKQNTSMEMLHLIETVLVQHLKKSKL